MATNGSEPGHYSANILAKVPNLALQKQQKKATDLMEIVMILLAKCLPGFATL